ncbi:MAG: hypothetical protein LBR97_00515 [Dysgonamonadaceae bacterium]|jgi:hypothetical protein|nr:hypothetical protein [Dysgonamonadaceae bacterium]
MQNTGNKILENYVSKTIGLTFRHKKPVSGMTKNLPQYLKGAFHFSLTEIDGQDFLLLNLSEKVDLPVSQIVKFAGQIRRQTGKPTLIQFGSMDSARRRTLISNRENFVVPDKQIYIPLLRMYLNESNSAWQLSGKEKLSPSSQFLLLYHLQKSSLEDLPFNVIAEKLGYSKKTISVVVSELQKLPFIEIKLIDDRNKSLCFKENSRQLWESVSRLMDSPVQKVWYIKKDVIPPDLQLYASYDTALSHYTFMADTSQSSYAVGKNIFSEYQSALQEFLHPEDGDIRLEIWKYNPALLANGQFIDKLSLALCYKDTEDERVHKEIKEMIDKTVW